MNDTYNTSTQPPSSGGGKSLVAKEIMRLFHAGFSLLPLGGGEDGKKPLLPFAKTPRLPLKQVLGPVFGTNSTSYGVRLDGLIVLDCDADDPDLIRQLQARFGHSPVQVSTPRGRHLYYRCNGSKRPNLRAEGIPVDVKSGPNSYVMGPHSIRPDGGRYTPVKGLLGMTKLPQMKAPIRKADTRNAPLPADPVVLPKLYRNGTRHDAIVSQSLRFAGLVSSLTQLHQRLQHFRNENCETPGTVPDQEVHDIAKWAWDLRLSGKLWGGKDSEFRLRRSMTERLLSLPGGTDAFALYGLLVAKHGHKREKLFCLDFEAMRDVGIFNLSRRRCLAARRLLEDEHVLVVAANHSTGNRHRLYQLSNGLPPIPGKGKEKKS